jgi:hypothetical protein
MTYKLKPSLFFLVVFTYVNLVLTFLWIMLKMVHTSDKLISYLLIIGFLVLLFYFIRYLTRAKLDVTLNDNEIFFEWERQFIFQNEPNFKINFSEINKYSYGGLSRVGWQRFILTLKNNKKIRIWHLGLTTFDDNFNKFFNEFKKRVYEYNEYVISHKSNSGEILRTKNVSFYTVQFSLIPLIFLFMGLIYLLFRFYPGIYPIILSSRYFFIYGNLMASFIILSLPIIDYCYRVIKN